MKVIIQNRVVDLDKVYSIKKEDYIRRQNSGCGFRIQNLILSVLNGNKIEFEKPRSTSDEDWSSFCDSIIEFWAENKKENIKTFNI